MNVRTRLLFKDRTIRTSIFVSSVLFIAMTGVLIYVYNSLPPLVPLYNQLPWGVSRLSQSLFIFLPLLVLISIFTLNIFLSSVIYEDMPLVSRILNITTVLSALLVLVFLARTLQLVL